MAVGTIDTYEVVKELKSTGFTESQAEAVARYVRQAQQIDYSELASKSDLSAVASDVAALKTDVAALKTDVAALKTDVAAMKSDLSAARIEFRAELRAGLSDTKSDILKWLIGAVGLQSIAVIAALITLSRMMR